MRLGLVGAGRGQVIKALILGPVILIAVITPD
jgi:hypothetical protein